jgi:starch synthase (maltosyl-transferring)
VAPREPSGRPVAAHEQPEPIPAVTGGSRPPLPDFAQPVVIERVRPSVDGGRFPVKRTAGELVTVTADVFAPGHDVIVALVRDRHVAGPGGGQQTSNTPPAFDEDDGGAWREMPMTLVAPGTDEWTASFEVGEVGWHEFMIEAWIDPFRSWQRDLKLKTEAGQDVSLDLLEGAELLEAAANGAFGDTESTKTRPPSDTPPRKPETESLRGPEDSDAAATRGDGATREATQDNPTLEQCIQLALSDDLARTMTARATRDNATVSRTFRIWVDRARARVGAWYEMFPRSAGPDPARSATFREAALRLAPIADLGFDVLYLPPIHPIGRSFRKGRNNALTAGPGDPGSPWAIGSTEGGHTAIEPGLGTLEDFDFFREEAERLGLEIALDVAWQCSPDHPWVTQHPDWFRHRPDGSIKYAENPPKKYQDIVPFDFGSPDWRSLWNALLGVVLFWVGRRVRIFRVDNPHTKTFGFWEWLIDRVHQVDPRVIFLSEAFTRPKVMRYLAKAGFTQSYTYFTWRNTKHELVDYFTELTGPDVREYLRPNLFANTPDILHAYLQTGGRPGFEARLLLAATLGASYGIYSGFELCEARAVKGTEEYADSEKYQFRQWDWDRPGHIKALIARMNEIRRAEPSLQSDWTLRFHATDNTSLIAYSKIAPPHAAGAALLVVVNLDPHRMQEGFIQVPLERFGVSPQAPYRVRDLLDDTAYEWRGEWNYVRLQPGVRQAHILKVDTNP